MTNTIATPTLDMGKLKELILYIAEVSQKDQRFGAVKLNKILFWADFEAYRRLGNSITGAEYQHLPEGPAPRQLLPARRQLEEDGSLEMTERPFHSYVQTVPQVKRTPNLRLFTPEEILIVDEVVEMLRSYTGADVSEISHREWGWRLTNDGETIEYRTAWLSPMALTEAQTEKAQQVAAARKGSHGAAG